MTNLYFGDNRWNVYNAIKWASENSEDKDVRNVCSMALADGKPSAFGYSLRVNEHWAVNIAYALAEYLKHVQDNQ